MKGVLIMAVDVLINEVQGLSEDTIQKVVEYVHFLKLQDRIIFLSLQSLDLECDMELYLMIKKCCECKPLMTLY